MKKAVTQTGIHCLFGERNKYNKEKKYEKQDILVDNADFDFDNKLRGEK